MLSNDTERKIAELFQLFSEAERSIEISRQVLSDCYDFNASQIFNKLISQDTEKNYLTYLGILNYLQNQTNDITGDDEEAIKLIIVL